MPRDLSSIVKAYDIRGTVGDELDAGLVTEFGAAFAELMRAEGAGSVVVGHDMRESSPGLAEAFAAGVTGRGLDVVSVGLCSTDMLYFASGHLDLPGAMFTASHNPAEYNGIKLCRPGAAPVGEESGLAEIRAHVERGTQAAGAQGSDTGNAGTDGSGTDGSGMHGKVRERELLGAYAEYLRSLVDLSGIRALRVVVDAGNGMAGYTVPEVFEGLAVQVEPMYFELDGSFPNHEANPLDPANIVDLQVKVRELGADAGIAFDGDADRCFLVDEHGDAVEPSAITALVAVRELARVPGSAVIHNLITSQAVPEIVAEHGGTPIRTRVGHSFIKAEMAETGAIFGGEHSAHYYFRDFWRADTGMLAALHVLAALGGRSGPLSELAAGYVRYASSGEINSTVNDQDAKLAEIKQVFGARAGASIDELDGLTVTLPGGAWFNLRASNTEPLLRCNVEAADTEAMERLRDEVLAIVRG